MAAWVPVAGAGYDARSSFGGGSPSGHNSETSFDQLGCVGQVHRCDESHFVRNGIEPHVLPARLQRVAGDPAYGAFAAAVDGEVAGFLGLQRGWAFEHERPYARILTLVVDGRMRRRGVGARLVEQAEAWGRGEGAYALLLNTNLRREEAHRFYEALGFRRTGWRYVHALG